MISDLRMIYRVAVDQSELFIGRVRTTTGESFTGQVVDVSARGAGIRFPHNLHPRLAIAQPVVLDLTCKRFKTPITLTAVTAFRRDKEDGHHFGFEFTKNEELRQQMTSEVQALFNRRQHFRVTPDPADPVQAAFRRPGDKKSKRFILADISQGGLGFIIGPHLESTMIEAQELQVALRLPGSQKTLVFGSQIKYRQLSQGKVRWGSQFEKVESASFEAALDKIID